MDPSACSSSTTNRHLSRAAAYAIGSTPSGVIIARAKHVDLRKHGSGNVGATNVVRVLGRRWGFLCFFLDVAKGFVPVLAAGMLIHFTQKLMAYLRRAARQNNRQAEAAEAT